MADETTTNGTASETSTAQDGQPSTPASTNAAPDRVAELERQLQQIRSNQGREAAELKRQLQAAQNQARELAMRDMSEVERLTYERNEAINFARQAQADADNLRTMNDRVARISELSRQTNVPFEELNKAETPDQLALIVHEWNSKLTERQVKEQVKEAIDTKAANRVDLGGGAPSTPITRYEKALNDAYAAKDTVLYTRLLREGKV